MVGVVKTTQSHICHMKKDNPKLGLAVIIARIAEESALNIRKATVSDILKQSSKWLATKDVDMATPAPVFPRLEIKYMYIKDERK